MQTKLTLRLEEQLIKKAKNWAKLHNISLSEAVAEFFKHLPDSEQPLELSIWTQSLVGVLKQTAEPPNEEEVCETYLDYLETKYQ